MQTSLVLRPGAFAYEAPLRVSEQRRHGKLVPPTSAVAGQEGPLHSSIANSAACVSARLSNWASSSASSLAQRHNSLAYIQGRRGDEAAKEDGGLPQFSSEWSRKAWENARRNFEENLPSLPEAPAAISEAAQQTRSALPEVPAELAALPEKASDQLRALPDVPAKLAATGKDVAQALSSVLPDAMTQPAAVAGREPEQSSALLDIPADLAKLSDKASRRLGNALSDVSAEAANFRDRLSERLGASPSVPAETSSLTERTSEQLGNVLSDISAEITALSDRASQQLNGLPNLSSEFGKLSEQASEQGRKLSNVTSEVYGLRDRVRQQLSQLPDVPAELAAARDKVSDRLTSLLPATQSSQEQPGFLQGAADALSSAGRSLSDSESPLDQLLKSSLKAFQPDSGELQPHFGATAIQSALHDAATTLGIGSAASGSQLPGGLRLPALPDGITSLTGRLSDQLSGGFSSGGSSPGLPPPQEVLQALGRSLTSLQTVLQDSATRGANVIGPDPTSVQPHFGGAALAEALQPFTSRLTMIRQGTGIGEVRFNASGVQSVANAVARGGQGVLEDMIHSVGDAISAVDRALQTSGAQQEGVRLLSSAASTIQRFEISGHAGYSAGFLAAVALAVAISVAASVPARGWDPLGRWVTWGEVPAIYDSNVLSQYYASRPVMVARRSLRLLSALAQFGSCLGVDYLRGQLYGNSEVRSRQLRVIIERLGPAYVKVAQALSTRVDILDAQYLMQIELLQDRVPPFPTNEALRVMEMAWGGPVEGVLSQISDEPVAAASLGQVYRGRLRGLGGGEVAIKVLRPGVLASVSLDLYLMRAVALLLQRLPSVRTDWAGLIEEWGKRFFAEMDYSAEAASADLFAQQMAGLPGIKVPTVYHELTTERVLTAEWVEGEKLSESVAGDVRQLCNTLLNCYLTQLLETGTLHADPHPGNLIRTPDGKICILDYGLMTDVTPQQSMALVEYISHLSVQDWASVPDDLRKLGFIAADAPDASAMVEPLGRILTQLSAGGGAKGVNIDQIMRDIETLSQDYPFEVPSYFALILRCFSVIEGIALRVDPSYSIVQECFPYLARRLLSDRDPRLQAALKATLYGGNQRIDIARLQRLASGFSRFTVDGITAPAPRLAQAPGSAASTVAAPLLDATARDALQLVFAAEGSYAAELLAEEAAAAVDALGRAAAFEVCGLVLGSLPAVAALQLRSGLPGPLQGIVPVPSPVNFLLRLQPLVEPSDEDDQALATARALPALLQGAAAAASGAPIIDDGAASTLPAVSRDRFLQVVQELSEILPGIAPGLLFTGNMFLQRLGSRFAARVIQRGFNTGTRNNRKPSTTGTSSRGEPLTTPPLTQQQAVPVGNRVSGSFSTAAPAFQMRAHFAADDPTMQQLQPQRFVAEQLAAASYLPVAIGSILRDLLQSAALDDARQPPSPKDRTT